MLHVERLASGLQSLLCEGGFVDVRICCSDHSPSDGLGAHRAMLAAASPTLLGPCLTGEQAEDDMVCLHLPDFSSSCVASVLSILYYGETWLGAHQVPAINSLLTEMGVNLEAFGEGTRVFLRRKTGIQELPLSPMKGKTIKMEPGVVNNQEHQPSIKKEKVGMQSSFPLIQSTSLLKCPNPECSFCSLSIPEIQEHICHCKVGSSPSVQLQHHAASSTQQNVELQQSSASSSLQYVEVRPVALKKENLGNFKQEAIDPLERKSTVCKIEKLDHEYKEGQQEDSIVIEEDIKELDDESEEILSISDTSSESSSREGSIKCELENCSYVTNSISSFKAHMTMHQRKRALQDTKRICPVCQIKSKTLAALREHIMNHASNKGIIVICNIEECNKQIDTKLYYNHVIHDHFGDQYKLKCDHCDFKTITTSKLKSHLMHHVDERPFDCLHCEQSFRSKHNMMEHMMVSHTKDHAFTCQECSKVFSTKQHLMRHNKSKHANEIFSCDQCLKKFSSQQSLGAHVRKVHKKASSGLICSKCGLRSGCECSKTKNTTNNTSVSCPVCEKQMLSRNLASHLHYHRQSSLRPYICQQCSQTFTHASSLKRHALIHSGVKPYHCSTCGKGFYQKVGLETHMKSHTTERLPCQGCGQPFLTQYLLNFHLKAKSDCRRVYQENQNDNHQQSIC